VKRLKESKELLDSLTKDHVRLAQDSLLNQIRRIVLKAMMEKNVTIDDYGKRGEQFFFGNDIRLRDVLDSWIAV